MTKTIVATVFYAAVFLLMLCGHAQNPLEREAVIFANAVDAEKIYLQLSGSAFNTSETIWFKALVTDVLKHRPTNRSAVLHVELIDPLDDRIVDSNILKISGGVAQGFFQLSSSYPEGQYIVRAYTEWNKNFGPDFISSVPIRLYRIQEGKPNPIRDVVLRKDLDTDSFSVSSNIAVMELDSLHTGEATLYMQWNGRKDSLVLKPRRRKPTTSVTHTVPLDVPIINYQLKTKNELYTKSIVLDQEYGSLQFFPEGGSLVTGLQSEVGFKYLDYRGKGTAIQGTIVDANNTTIAEFESNSLGMGRVQLTPEAGQTYFGVLTTQTGNTFKYELPQAKERGLVLKLTHKGATKEVKIRNKERNRDSVFVKLFHRGKNLFFLKSRFRNGKFSYNIPSKSLPHGVIGLTVFDKHYRPVAERHFFNNKPQEKLDITLQTDKDSYAVRDSVQVSISAQHKGRSLPASVSVMAVDSNYFYGTNLDRNTIVSYFLLQSDIKGAIENPSYYFENNENLADLDFLMLTQGWTNYKYKEKKKPRRFVAEKGLEVKGTIGGIQKLSGKRSAMPNTFSVNMLMMGEPMKAYSQTIDKTGRFKFLLDETYGNGRKFIIQPADQRNESKDFKVNIQKRTPPEIAYEVEQLIVPVDEVVEQKMVEKIRDDIKYDPFLLASTVALNEVVVSDYKITPERAEMVELHGMPDVVIDNSELLKKQKKWTRSLYRWLLFNFPKELRIRRVGPTGEFEMAFLHGADFTYVVIDGIPVHIEEYRLIGNIPVRAVKSVEIIRNTSSANKYHFDVFPCAPVCPPPPFPAILAIYTYTGKGLWGAFPRGKTPNLIIGTAPEYAPIREFYVPEYQEPSKIDWDVPDRRTLLFWKPNMITDSNGETKTTFFNSDLTGKMVIICEGITANGSVGYAELTYEVDNR